jgi:probable F420-dependent oxidoreductase
VQLAVQIGGAFNAAGGNGTEALIAQARLAEELGFGALFLPDHYVYEQLGELKTETPAYDLFFALATLARSTARIRLVAHVACTLFRHPAMTARLFAQADESSGGRVVAGVGAGWTRAEFAMMGIEFPPISERLRRMDEAVTIMRDLWTRPTTTFEGEFYTVRDAVCLPKPAQSGGLPLMLGGGGRGILRRAGRWADMLHLAPVQGKAGTTDFHEVAKFTDDSIPERMALVREEEERAGRAPGTVKLATTVFQFVPTTSADETRTTAEGYASLLGISAEAVLRHPVFLIGRPEEMADELRRRRETHGMEMVGINCHDADELRRMADMLMPHL